MKKIHPRREEERPENRPPTEAKRPSGRRTARLAWAIVAAGCAAVLFAYTWPENYRNVSHVYVSAAWVAFMIRTMQYHFGLFLLLCAVWAALGRRWRLAVVTMTLSLVCVTPSLVYLIPRATSTLGGDSLQMMSVNLFAFNSQKNETLAKIRREAPDLLLIQEYHDAWHAVMHESLAPDYPYSYCEPRGDCFGIAIYSKRPFVAPVERVRLGSDLVPQLRTEIVLQGKRVALYNVHLFPPTDVGVLETRLQFADLLDVIAAERLPILAGGDFNFTEHSAQAFALARLGLADVHDLAGQTRGDTWHARYRLRFAPGFRLDHIYLRGGLTADVCRIGDGPGSDHRPVIARVGFPREKNRQN